MSIAQGSSSFVSLGYTLVSSRPVYDQANGPSWEVVYEGGAAALTTLAVNLQSSGARTVLDRQPGISRLSANYVADPDQPASAEVAADRWSILWEEDRQSLLSSPVAIAEAQGYVSVAKYKADIENAVKDGDAFPLEPSSQYPVGQFIYNLLSSNIETYPVYSPLLRRTRTYSLTYTGAPQQVTLQGIVYTRAALLREFGIVNPLASRIPTDPSVALPAGLVWGWYLAQQEFDYTRERGAVKVAEVLGWRFGKWNAYPQGSALQGINILIT